MTRDYARRPSGLATPAISDFWRVEMDPLRLNVYRLVGDVCELSGSWVEDEIAFVAELFEVTVELSTLLP